MTPRNPAATNVLILGGYGNAGYQIARFLVQYTNVHIVLAGRSGRKAKLAAEKLNELFEVTRVRGMYLDVKNAIDLAHIFELMHLVIVASSTMRYFDQIITTAITTRTDVLDILLSISEKHDVFDRYQSDIDESGIMCLTDGGYHPGVPAAMVRRLGIEYDQLHKANVSAAFQIDWSVLEFSRSTMAEFVEELLDYDPRVLRDGKWIKMKMRDMPTIDFGAGWGERSCPPMFMREFEALPDKFLDLKETGFFIAGFNKITDNIILPIAYILYGMFGRLAKGLVRRLLVWSLRKYSQPPYQAILQLYAEGFVNNKLHTSKMSIRHQDAYELTAIPVVAAVRQYLDGKIDQGVKCQALAVEPYAFFEDISMMGVTVSYEQGNKKLPTN